VQTDIKSGVGNSHTSAERERRLIEDAVANRSVTGTDGKQYPAQPKRKPYEPTSEEGRLRVVTATVRRMEHIADEVAKIVNDTATHPREDDGPLRTRMADAAYQISDAAEHLRVAIPYSPTQLPKLPTPEALAIIGREWTKQLTGTVAKTMDDDGMVYLSIERVTQIAEFMTAAAALLEKQR
jgi:hypothetical protein